MMKARIAVVQGSMDEKSATSALIQHAGRLLEQEDIVVDYIDLRELNLPLFERCRAGGLTQYRALAPIVESADGYLLGTPDYHGNPSGTLKNFLDYFWREFTGKLFGYICVSHDKGLSAMDALRIAVRQCYGWSLPYGVSAVSGIDVDASGAVCSDPLRAKLQMLALDMARYTRVLSAQRKRDLAATYPTFLEPLR